MTHKPMQMKGYWRLGIAVLVGAIAGIMNVSPGLTAPREISEQQVATPSEKTWSPACKSTGTIPPNHPDVQALKELLQKYKTAAVLESGDVPIPRCEFAAVLSAVSDQVDNVIRSAPPSLEFPISKETVATLLRLYRAYDTELAFFPANGSVGGDGRAGSLERQVLFRSPIRLRSGEEEVIDEAPFNPADAHELNFVGVSYGCGLWQLSSHDDRSLARYEFAAALNACVQKLNQLTADGVAVKQEDWNTLHHLETAYASELTNLRHRLAELEKRNKEFEEKQFSPTTKLNGEVVLELSGVRK